MSKRLELTEETDFTLTITHVRRAGHCPSGAKRWFIQQGFDFKAFLREGMSAKHILENGDGLAEQVIRHAMEAEDGKKQ